MFYGRLLYDTARVDTPAGYGMGIALIAGISTDSELVTTPILFSWDLSLLCPIATCKSISRFDIFSHHPDFE
jgi:hypothetical protein